jgi:HD-like signal output (HDOD) protein
VKPVSDFLLIERINQCPKLASLQSINETLATLLDSDESLLHQVAEVIRLDPSLTTRVLDLVNSIFFGSDHDDKITGIEEASIFLGLNRIRELLSTTPIIEEIADLGNGNANKLPWTHFWRHSIGTAILTREILAVAEYEVEMEADYIAGLLHNLGIIILAITFPEEFDQVYTQKHINHSALTEKEQSIIGWNHAKTGAYYLWNHHISENIVEAVNFHNSPELAKIDPKLCSAVHIADQLTRRLGLKGFEKVSHECEKEMQNLSGWRILFPENNSDSEQSKVELVEGSLTRLKETLTYIL